MKSGNFDLREKRLPALASDAASPSSNGRSLRSCAQDASPRECKRFFRQQGPACPPESMATGDACGLGWRVRSKPAAGLAQPAVIRSALRCRRESAKSSISHRRRISRSLGLGMRLGQHRARSTVSPRSWTYRTAISAARSFGRAKGMRTRRTRQAWASRPSSGGPPPPARRRSARPSTTSAAGFIPTSLSAVALQPSSRVGSLLVLRYRQEAPDRPGRSLSPARLGAAPCRRRTSEARGETRRRAGVCSR